MTQKATLCARANRVKRDSNYTASKCHTAFSLITVSRCAVYEQKHHYQVEVSENLKCQRLTINYKLAPDYNFCRLMVNAEGCIHEVKLLKCKDNRVSCSSVLKLTEKRN